MNTAFTWPRRGIYLLTPDEADTGRLLARLEPLLALRPALLQYRNKAADAALRAAQARALKTACDAHGVPLVVNDDWRLARELGAAGAHLGEHDGTLAEARAQAPGLWFGASCYDDPARAHAAAAAGADYLAFGAFFPSGTKPLARRADAALLRQARGLGRPLVAIGGITPDNAGGLVAAGADLLAVIGGVFDAPDPAAALRSLQHAFESNDPENTNE